MTDIERYLLNLRREQDGAALYNAMAEIEKDAKLAEVYKRLAGVETRHAETWAQKLRDAGISVPKARLSWRTGTMIMLARRFGVGFVLPSVASLEQIDSNGYAQQMESGTTEMVKDERSHSRLLRHISGGSLGGSHLARLEGRHGGAGGNAFRAAVFGANDGLVSVFSLAMGVAGAELSNSAVLITCFAGLLAGAISMSLGEWLSVQSSRELYQYQIGIERAELLSSPAEEAEELALIYQAKGLDEARARDFANEIIKDEDKAVETLAREELGIDPESLGGSPWEAAGASFSLFAAGAVLPVLPFAMLNGNTAILVSIILSAIGLFVIGAVTTLFTGRSVIYSGMRQVMFGLVAAGVTYGIGHLIGIGIAG